ncbi:proline-rich protein 11 isoform X2 [Amblyraja radiata]|uniref:proline-rich protein 11 isoform X2 n=1 Tax=Amblyraja radiata TaxID=386614 RepID=UPI0014034B6E|nr:proline-rich protein 11 isoform X2 [Amblyraja radiata]
MYKLNQRRKKWKMVRKWHAIGKSNRNSKRHLLAKHKGCACKPKPTTCQTPEKEDMVTSNSNSFLHESVPVGLISLVNVKNLFNPLQTVVYSIYSWWLRNIRQGFELIKDTLFPSRVYLRELNVLRQHIESLEIKVTHMQEFFNEQHQEPNTAKATEVCFCRKHFDSLPVPNKIPIWPVQPIVSCTPLKSPNEAPPPPPPPPPPLPPCSLFAVKPLQIQTKTREKHLQAIGEEILRPPSITIKDLLQVKLKRTVDRFELIKMNPEKKDGPPSVTIKDLLDVKLRVTQNKVEKAKMDAPGKRRSPLVTIHDLQSFNLQRKVNQLQKPTKMMSPGGTPLHKESKDTATGLTPVMTQALRRKFEMAHPKSPPQCCSSPNTSFDEQHAC